ncbi:phospholipase A and acyltransferase 3-like [Mercenaria mercenaria]|uniref:phospholipase A and acyltransferase 3-like n=1 Tax=Mercenaria mercenaria TaxID=6596 RepID=UPI00234EE76D|nr:phospholipase A and acyltransferase 3-like [Mercenaria mercenaria]
MTTPRNMYVQQIEAVLEEGDLVEFVRANGVFTHHGVYVGNGEIIHLGLERKDNPRNLPSLLSAPGRCEVRKDKLTDVAKHSDVSVNNRYDNTIQPFTKTEIVKRAYRRLGEKGYNPLFYNCEHFATECRYGKPLSSQIERLEEVGKLVVDTGLELIKDRAFPAGIKQLF